MSEVKKQLIAAVANQPDVLDATKTIEAVRNLNAKAEVTVLYRKAKDQLETPKAREVSRPRVVS